MMHFAGGDRFLRSVLYINEDSPIENEDSSIANCSSFVTGLSGDAQLECVMTNCVIGVRDAQLECVMTNLNGDSSQVRPEK